MIVTVSGPDAAVTDAGDLTRLHVELDGTDDAGADTALRAAGLGHLDGDHAWLSVEALRAQGAGAAPDWNGRYDAMVEYALGKGWCTEDRTHLQAHVERKADA